MHLSLSFRGLLISRFSGLCRSCFTCTRTLCISRQIAPQMVTMLLHTARWCYFETKCYRCDRQLTALTSGAARGKGEASPHGWTSKNYVICVCFHCHGTSSYHTTNTLQGRRATLIQRQYKRDWGTSYSGPPIDPYLTSPLLQNPGGATGLDSGVTIIFGPPSKHSLRANSLDT